MGAVAIGAAIATSQCYGYVDVLVMDGSTGNRACDAEVSAARGDDVVPFTSCFYAPLTEGKWLLSVTKPGYQGVSSEILVNTRDNCERVVHQVSVRLDSLTPPPTQYEPPPAPTPAPLAPAASPPPPAVAPAAPPPEPSTQPPPAPGTAPAEPPPAAAPAPAPVPPPAAPAPAPGVPPPAAPTPPTPAPANPPTSAPPTESFPAPGR